MQYYDLNDDELEILKDFESDDYKTSCNKDSLIKELKSSAKKSLNKTKNINIRLSEKDIYNIKVEAAREGLPYQTLISSVLHKFATSSKSS